MMRRFKVSLGIACLCLLILPFFYTGKAHAADPTILITEPLIGQLFPIQSDVTLKGTTTPNSQITLSTEDGEYAKLTSDSNGNWSYTIPTVSGGSHTVVATVTVKIDALSSKNASANVTYNVGSPNESVTTKLSETGVLVSIIVCFGVFMLLTTAYTYIDYRRHKRPLRIADPHVHYSFWHHLQVVSIPVLRYRLSINLEKRLPGRSDSIRRY